MRMTPIPSWLISVPGRRDSGEQLGIFGVFHDVFEREPDGALAITRDDQRSNLDNLALSPRGRTCLVLGTGDVDGCGDVVAATRSQYGEQGKLDGEMSHVGSVQRAADAGLTSH